MAINISSPNGTFGVEHRDLVAPQSLTGIWQDCVFATKVAVTDAGTITQSSELDSILRAIIDCRVGTSVLLRMKYPSNLTVTTPPTVAVFGLEQVPGSGNPFTNFVIDPLYSANGNLSETLSVNARDTTATVGGAVWKYTIPDPTVHAWDRLGSSYIVVGVTVAVAGTTGDPGLCTIQYKVI